MKFGIFWLLACVLFAGGCEKHSPVDGTYHDSRSNLMTLYLNRGDAEISFGGMTKELTYELVGNQLTLKRSDGRTEMTFIVNSDGSLQDSRSGNTMKRADS